jgi:hypothetical protein
VRIAEDDDMMEEGEVVVDERLRGEDRLVSGREVIEEEVSVGELGVEDGEEAAAGIGDSTKDSSPDGVEMIWLVVSDVVSIFSTVDTSLSCRACEMARSRYGKVAASKTTL